MIKKKTYIVSTYDNYEWITTKDTYSLLLLKLQYMRMGHTVFAYPLWFVMMWYKITGRSIFKDKTAVFEKYVPGSGQITYHTPYHNFY